MSSQLYLHVLCLLQRRYSVSPVLSLALFIGKTVCPPFFHVRVHDATVVCQSVLCDLFFRIMCPITGFTLQTVRPVASPILLFFSFSSLTNSLSI